MNEHAGLGCVLSVLIVVTFTLLFHERDRPNPVATRVAPHAASRPPSPPAPTPRGEPAQPAVAIADVSGPQANATPPAPAPTTAQARLVATGRPEASAGRPSRLTPPGPAVVAASLVAVVAEVPASRIPRSGADRNTPAALEPRPTGRRSAAEAPAAPTIRAPRSSSTSVEAGERLADVAARVYGSPQAVDRLWRANRDRLGAPDDPVAEGLLLRTP